MTTDNTQRQQIAAALRARLAVLQLQRAKFGELHVPPHIVTEIAEIEAQLADLKAPAPAPTVPGGAPPLRLLALIAAPLIAHNGAPVVPLAVQEELEAIRAACEDLDEPAARCAHAMPVRAAAWWPHATVAQVCLIFL